MPSLKFNFSSTNNTFSRIFVFVIFLSTVSFSAQAQVPDRPDAVYNPDTDSYFELVKDGSTWYEAYDKAQALAPDAWTGRLAPLATQEERDFVIYELGFHSNWAIYWTGLECDPDEAYQMGGPGYSYSVSCQSKTTSRSHFYVEYTPGSITISSDSDNGWVQDGKEILAVEAEAVLNLSTLRDKLLDGDVSIVAGKDIVFDEVLTLTENPTLTLKAGGDINLAQNATIETNGDIILESDDVDIHSDASLKSNGELIIRPRTTDTPITIGIDNISDALELPVAYFNTNFEAGFSQVTIGSEAQTGDISLNSIEFRDDMRLQTGGVVVVKGDQIITLPNGVRFQVDNALELINGASIKVEAN